MFFAVMMMAGCKKDSTVTPVKNYSTIKLASADSSNLDGGKSDPLRPPHQP
jgi:hypothetical protein